MTFGIETNYGLTLNMDFWLQTTAIYNEYSRTDAPFTGPSISPTELDQVQRNLFPNFNVSLQWNYARPKRFRGRS